MFYVLHGEEEYLISEQVSRYREKVLQASAGELNVATFDGRRADVQEVINACNALPFLGERRLVIVYGMLQQMAPRGKASKDLRDEFKGLLTYLEQMPETARLVFVESKTLSARHPVLQLAQKVPGGYERSYPRLSGAALKRWIAQRIHEKGLAIAPAALDALLQGPEEALRTIDGRLDMLAAYADYKGEISADDVRALIPASHEARIFDLVDALGMRQASAALGLLETLLTEGEPPLLILTMIGRQVRMLISAKECAHRRLSGREFSAEIGLRSHSDYVVNKVRRQSEGFQLAELEEIHRRVLELDHAIKTGRMEDVAGLELLIVETCASGKTATRIA